MVKTYLNTRSIQRQGPVYLWDTELKGFGARIASDGRVSWLIQKWTGGRGGKAARTVIGHYPPMLPDEARALASQQLSTGKPPKTLSQVADTYFVKRSKPGRYWSELRTRFAGSIVPGLGTDRDLASITKAELRALIEAKEAKYPVASRTMYEALRPFFKWCVQQDYLVQSPMTNITPPPIPDSRDRVLTYKEIVNFWVATERLGYPFCPFYRLLLLTGQRRNEVAGMAWHEIDVDHRLWTIPKERTKNGRVHLVNLSPQALEILGLLPVKNTNHVFATKETGHISGYSKAKSRLDKLMDTYDWRIHDLRRTVASGMAGLGILPHVIDKVLNHTNSGVREVYQRWDYFKERKEALERWGDYIEGLTKG